jgi:hypothetical protein
MAIGTGRPRGMHRPVEKATRRIQAEIAKRQGPVRKDQEAAPIADAMRSYWEREIGVADAHGVAAEGAEVGE